MRVLLALLLVGIAGCGEGSSPPGGGTVPTPEGSQAKVDKSPAEAALEKIGAKIKQNEQGEVIEVWLTFSQITDADLVHLKEMSNLTEINLESTEITDAGLVHLKGLTKLQNLSLHRTKITDAGVAELKKALPKCKLSKVP